MLSVCLTPDGQWVMSGSKDRGVQFWDPVTGNAQMMLQGHKNSGESIVRLLVFAESIVCCHTCHHLSLGVILSYHVLVRRLAMSCSSIILANFSADSHLGGPRPDRQPLRNWQWRHACTDLEVSKQSLFPSILMVFCTHSLASPLFPLQPLSQTIGFTIIVRSSPSLQL